MKTNTIFKLIAVVLCASVMLTSCIEETVLENGNATAEQVGNSPFAGGGVLVAVPTIMMSNGTTYTGEHIEFGYLGLLGALDRMAGEVFPVSGNMSGGNQYYDRWQFALYPGVSTWLNNTGSASYWFYRSYYEFVATANSAISVFASTGEPSGNLGAAYALRAMMYMDMARLYDPLPAVSGEGAAVNYTIPDKVTELTVPLVTELTSLEQMENNPRIPRNSMWAFILNDLNNAETMIANDEFFSRPSIGVPDLAAVYGLKARAYLWLGGFTEAYGDVTVPGQAEGAEAITVNVPTGSDAYRLAAEYARKAINASGATIMNEAQWLDPKTGFCVANNSWLLGLCQSTDTVINNLYSWTAHMSIDACWGYGPGSQPGVSVFTYNRMNDTDFRKKNIVGPERDYDAIAPYTMLTEAEFEGEVFSPIAPYAWIKFHTNGGEKYDYSLGNVTDIPLMRVEEMYLIEAEATAHYDQATAGKLLTAFMATRDSGYTLATTDLVEEIIFQKRVEFWGEGIIIFDLKRLNYGMTNGNDGSNAPTMNRLTTNGRAPWWNLVLPLDAEQQNSALLEYNNPNACKTYNSND